MIKESLESRRILNVAGGSEWTINSIRSILTNEKYYGDVLMQKTFTSDCISKKTIRNTGQLPMYLIQNHHAAIIDRKQFDAVKAEMARRNAGKSPSKKYAPIGLTSYASKCALSERLICGECGTLYRRCTWARNGKKRIVWRCVSRLDYGTKYCHHSPSLDETVLQKSILAAINSAMSHKKKLIAQISSTMEQELSPSPGEGMSLADIERRLEELEHETKQLVIESTENGFASYTEQFQSLMDEAAELKKTRAAIQEYRKTNTALSWRIENAIAIMERSSSEITHWDEPIIRQLVDTVKVESAEKITVYLRGGIEIHQDMLQ